MAVARARQGTNAAASAAQARSRAVAQQASQPQPARSAALRSNAPPAVTLGPPAVGPAARRQAVMTRLRNAAARQQGAAASPATQRQASREAAAEASRAASSPANEARAQAQAGQAEVMGQQRAGSVQQNTFLELVERQLNAVPMPRNPEEMDRFRQNGSAGGLRQQLQTSVGEQSAQAQNNIRSATEAQPSAGANRQPDALPPQGGPPTRGNLRTQEILPERRTEQQVSLDASRQQVEGQMRENNLTEERLREANDPRFTAVQEARESVHEQAQRAPEEYRAAEQAELQRQENAVTRDEQAATREMSADRERANAQVATQQRQAMTREEAARRQVSERIERMFTEAQTRVQNKLTWLDGEVDRRFTEGEARAKQMFETFVEDAMYRWKLRRYGRWLFVPGIGAAYALGRWVADKLTDISQFPEIQAIYDGGKRLYVRKMRELIVEIAGTVETTLRWCTDEIARARTQIQDYVNSLPQSLRSVGEETSRGVSERFDQLRNTVNERREALANRLVERYRQAQQALDRRIQQMQAANRGLINRFVAAVREVIEIINNFRRQLMSLIGEARSVIDRIVERPVNFLRNLVRALRMGFDQFSRNIWNHLRSALLNWLFGTLAQAGIQIPQTFDLRSIIGLILQILGISYAQIRGKIARIIGERNMALLEHAWRYVSALIREGPIGLWNEIRNDLGNLWEMALQAVREWVVTNLVRAAITRLVSMFNPVGAIIQAVLAIYNTVMFFVEKIQQIMELVRTVVRSLDKIVRGDLAEAANWVENAMARTLPIIISFLARLLGLSGIADRIREFIQNIQARVDRAIDAALERIVGGLRRLFGRGGAPGAAGAQGAARAGVQNIDRPFSIAQERHTLRGHLEGGRVTFLMASDGFGAVQGRINELRQHFVVTYLPAIGKPNEAQSINMWLNMVENLNNEYVRRVSSTTNADAQRQLTEEGVAQMFRYLNLVNERIVRLTGEWARIRVNDIILMKNTRPVPKVAAVKRIMSPKPFGARTLYGVEVDIQQGRQRGTGFFPYENYGSAWEIKQANLPGSPGSRETPFKMEWPKPASDKYPTLYFGGRSSTTIPQSVLEARYKANPRQKDPNGHDIQAYTPHGGGTLSGGESIGIIPRWYLDVGTLVGPISTTGTSGGRLINNIIKEYGFDLGVEKKEGDHVHEMQMGGANVVGNLWPLDKTINGSAGSTIAGARVKFPTGTNTVKISDLKEDTTSQYFCIITKVR